MAKMTKAELIRRDRKRDIGNEVLQAIRDIKSGKTGRILRADLELAELARTRAKERRIKVKIEDL